MSYTINTRSQFGQPLVTYSGVASGINTQAIVDAETQTAGYNQAVLTRGAADDVSKSDLYANIASQLGTLDRAISGLKEAGLFAPSSATISDASKVAITATRTAQTGSYAVSVTQLASNQINASSNFQTANSTVIAGAPPATVSNPFPTAPNSGSISIKVGTGAAKTFDLTKTTTLSQLASTINASGLAVKATVVNDANGFRISLEGKDTGAANAITFTETNSKVAFASTQVQAAKNAQGTVNGKAFDLATNTASGLVTGVTMNFVALTGAPVTLSVFKNATSVSSSIQTFVLNYNAAVTGINSATAYSEKTNLGNLLGDSGIQNLSRQLGQAVSQAPQSATGSYRTLADVGVTYNLDGTLNLDTAVLNSAINSDASSVANLLSSTSAGAGLAEAVDKITSSYGGPAGLLMQMSQAQGAIGKQAKASAEDLQYTIDRQQDTLQKRFVAFETSMASLQAQNMLVESFAASLNAATASQNAGGVSYSDDFVAAVRDEEGPIAAIDGQNGYVPVVVGSQI